MSDITPLILQGEEIVTDDCITTLHPYDRREVGRVARADAKLMERAIAGAYSARRAMADLTHHHREEILLTAGDMVQEESERLAELITLEMGKIIKESRGEVARCECYESSGKVLYRGEKPEVLEESGVRGKWALYNDFWKNGEKRRFMYNPFQKSLYIKKLITD